MKLRTHLLLMSLAVLLPVVLLGISGTVLLAQRERLNYEQRARERTRAVMTTVDAALTGHGMSLLGLASSRHLEAGDLEAFYDEAVRTRLTQTYWHAIDLSLPSGEIVLDTPSGSALTARSFRDREGFQTALRTGQISVGGLADDAGTYRYFAVHLPVHHNGNLRYVLTALVDPEAILGLLVAQELPSDWVGVVLDSNRRIIARTLHHERTLGQPAADGLFRALDDEAEGFFRDRTIEGADVFAVYNRSSISGWTVALGIPAAAVTDASLQAARRNALGISTALLIAIILAYLLSRRIASPFASLASIAKALGTGASVDPPRPGGILEVRQLHEALANASTAVRDREDALRAADRAKDEFLAMLSHELRNPLGALASAAALLQHAEPKRGATDPAAAVVARQVRHMTRLVDDLLDVSRATSGKISLSRGPVNLAEIAGRALATLRSAGQLDRHELHANIAPAWVHGDEARLEQVISNLVGNAVKYTPPGGTITVRVAARDGDAVFEVSDTGIGLTPELAAHVFDLFVQGDRSLDRHAGGLGIGLTLVRRLVELHDGRVDVHSEGPGRGSSFKVTLPAGPPAGRSTRDDHSSEVAPHPARRVLLIEDHDDARLSLRILLEQQGYVLAEAADGPSGLATAKEFCPDVAIVDIGLGGMDGYEVARRLRRTPESAHALLIALTGYGQEEARQQALEAGFDAHLTKPVSPLRLVELIESRLAASLGAL